MDSSLHVQSQVTAHTKPFDFLPEVARFLFCHSNRPSSFPIAYCPIIGYMPNFVYISAPLASLYTSLPLYIHPFDLPFLPRSH